MKKTLISAAILASAAGAAQAQMSIYGLIDMSYGKSLYTDVFLRGKADINSGGDNGSGEGNSTTRFGLKGSADVGSGNKINFRLESGGITSDGAVRPGGAFFDRQAWLGMSGGFGEVRVGRQDSVSFQTMIDYDFNGASNGVSAGFYSLTAPWFPGRQSRSVQYISPNMGGVTAQIGFVPEGSRETRETFPQGVSPKAVASAGLKYASGPLSVAASVQTKDRSNTENFMSVAGSYDFKVVKVMLGYADGGDFTQGGTGSGITAGFVAPVGSVNVGMQYGQNTDDALKLRSVELFVNSEVFKNTYAYFEVGNWKTSLATNPLDGFFGATNGKRSGTGFAAGVIFVF